MPVVHTLKIETQQEFNVFVVRTLEALLAANTSYGGRLRDAHVESVTEEIEALKAFTLNRSLNGE